MKKLSLLAVALCLLLSVPAPAAENPTGYGASLMLAANLCVEQGDASCSGVDPSFGFTLGGVWRSSTMFGVTADFFYGMFDVPGDLYSMGLLVGPRVYIPIGNLALFAGLQAGWGRAAGSGGYDNNHLIIAFQLGGEFYVFDNLGVGAWMRWHMPIIGEDDADFSDYNSDVMAGAGVTYYF